MCPYHAWPYHCDGRLRHACFPDRKQDFKHEEYRLPPVRVESLCGLLFVNMDPEAQPLARVAGGMAEDLAVHVPRLDVLASVESFAFDAGGGTWRANRVPDLLSARFGDGTIAATRLDWVWSSDQTAVEADEARC